MSRQPELDADEDLEPRPGRARAEEPASDPAEVTPVGDGETAPVSDSQPVQEPSESETDGESGDTATARGATDVAEDDRADGAGGDSTGSGTDRDAPDGDGPVGPEGAATGSRTRWNLPRTTHGRIIAIVLTVALVAAAGAAVWLRVTALPADAAFRLDGDVVTVDQLDQRIDTLRALYGVEQPQEPDRIDAFRRDVAKSVALSDILDKAAADRQIVVADKQVSDTLDRYVEQQFGAGGRDTFVRALGNVGTSEAAVRDEIRRQLTVNQLMQQVVGVVTVSDQDVRAAYDQRRNSLGTPEKRSIRNIVVTSEQAARSALDQIRSGTPIEQVAATRSLDASTKDKGGALGDVARTDLEQPVADGAFEVAAGGLYGPVKGTHGWNIGRVDGVTPFVPATFDQVEGGLKQVLQAERSLAIWKDWLSRQITDADVEYADVYRPADPDAVPSPQDPATPQVGSAPPR